MGASRMTGPLSRDKLDKFFKETDEKSDKKSFSRSRHSEMSTQMGTKGEQEVEAHEVEIVAASDRDPFD